MKNASNNIFNCLWSFPLFVKSFFYKYQELNDFILNVHYEKVLERKWFLSSDTCYKKKGEIFSQ